MEDKIRSLKDSGVLKDIEKDISQIENKIAEGNGLLEKATDPEDIETLKESIKDLREAKSQLLRERTEFIQKSAKKKDSEEIHEIKEAKPAGDPVKQHSKSKKPKKEDPFKKLPKPVPKKKKVIVDAETLQKTSKKERDLLFEVAKRAKPTGIIELPKLKEISSEDLENIKEAREALEAKKVDSVGDPEEEEKKKADSEIAQLSKAAANTSSEQLSKTEKRTKTRRTNKILRERINDIPGLSDAKREEIRTKLNKRQRTKKDQEFLNKVFSEIDDSGGSGKPPIEKKSDESGDKTQSIPTQLAQKIKEPKEVPVMVFPSTTIILAKKFSGKTNLLLNIVNRDDFDNTWIVSMTHHLGKLDRLVDDEESILETVSDAFVIELLKMHQKEPMTTLIIFDDVIGQVNLNSKPMQRLATAGRNFGISIIISTQDYFKTPPVWRRNSEYWWLGSMTDSNIQASSKELSVPSMPKKRIQEELSDIARDKAHDWLFYDDRKTRFQKVFGNQFEVFI